MRKLQCDNSDCETNGTNIGIREPGVKVSEDLGITVTRAEDVGKMKNNPRLCNSCQKETEIVFSKDNVRLCKECLDAFRDRYGSV